MKLSLRHCRFLLVAGYLAFNLAAYVETVNTGVLSGDFAGVRAPAGLTGLVLLLFVALSYVVVLFPLFDWMRGVGRIGDAGRNTGTRQLAADVFVLLLSAFQLVFALDTGVGVAGEFARSDNPLRFIIYIIPIDFVAMIYLAAADNGRLYKANFGLYLVSSLARGWSSGILFLLLIALIRSNGLRLTPARLLGGFTFVAVVAPLILVFRFLVRDESVELLEILSHMDVLLDGRNLYLFILGFLSDRLQQFMVVAYIFENRGVIGAALNAGEIRPFFLDGTFFPALAGLLGRTPAPELNSWLTAHFYGTDFDAISYNVHVSFIGWPILAPELLPIYVLFVCGLGLGSMLLSRALGSAPVVELTWMMWLLLLVNGWFGAFVNYLVALAFVRLGQLAMRRMSRRQRRRQTHTEQALPGVRIDGRRADPPRPAG
jgi:hypothetical protein